MTRPKSKSTRGVGSTNWSVSIWPDMIRSGSPICRTIPVSPPAAVIPVSAAILRTLRSAKALPSGVYAEVNLSANHLRDQIKTLLDVFEIEPMALRIYLRQDRDAEPA
jgi:hypothetical protein